MMTIRSFTIAAVACAAGLTWSAAGWAQAARPALEFMRAPPGSTWEQVLRGDRVFHGELHGGRCSVCHGWDAKGTANGNDLTLGMWIWGDGSLKAIKANIRHNMSVAPGMDGPLTDDDVDAVAAYVWALGHQRR